MSSSMTPREYVEQLYELCLGRSADPGGLDAWTSHLAATGDPTSVLAGLLASEEAQRRGLGAVSADHALLTDALELLGRSPRVVDVGAQALDGEDHVYAPLARAVTLEVVGFDPLADRLEERASTEGDAYRATYLPYALGDGSVRTLFVNNDDATSSLFPLDLAHNADFDHLCTLRTAVEVELQTRRLDDVLPPGPVDLLKLDVQGAELLVLHGAHETLARTGVVHCEVEFAAIYAGQPLFADVERELKAHGFYLVDLLTPLRYAYVGTWTEATPDRLLWGEAVFFRSTSNPQELIAQAVVAAGVYGKRSLARSLLYRSRS